MKSIFSKLTKSSLFNHALRLAIVLVGLSYSAAAAAAAWTATYTMNIGSVPAGQGETTGKGIVYMTDQSDNSSASGTLKKGDLTVQEISMTDTKKNDTQQHTWSVQLQALQNVEADAGYYGTFLGSYFAGWYVKNGENYELVSSENPYKLSDTFLSTKEEQEEVVNPTTYYVKFLSKTYHAKWPEVEIVVYDKQGNKVTNAANAGANKVTVSVGVPAGITTGTIGGDRESKTYTFDNKGGTTIFTQTSDNAGEDAQASYTLSYSATADTDKDYYFVGWTTDLNTDPSTSVTPNSGTLTMTSEKIPTETTPGQATKYYAVFRQNYTSHFTAPAVALANNQPENCGTLSVSPTAATTVINNNKTTVTYTATSTYYATFVGWSEDADGSSIISGSRPTDFTTNSHTFQREYTATFANPTEKGDPTCTIPTLYAVYESFYYKAPQLHYSTKNNSSHYGTLAVSANGTRPADNSEAWKTENITADNAPVFQIATGGATERAVDLHYHAKAADGAVFIAFTSDEAGETILGTEGQSDYTDSNGTFKVSSKDKNNPSPGSQYPVYAVFQTNQVYYYRGAIAGFTSNGEKGKVTVTGYTLSSNDQTTAKFIEKHQAVSTTDANIDDSNNTHPTELNVQKYAYKYVAEQTDSKTTFKGWSRSAMGSNIISTDLTYQEVYTTYATQADNAPLTPALYAVFQSYWYKDPSATAIGAGQVAVTTDAAKPTTGWANAIDGSQLNQQPADDEHYKYAIYYHAQPNFGAKFVGWSNMADGSQLLTDEKATSYQVDYTVTNTDDTAPFVPARLYAVFQSVISIIQQDRMIYFVDEHGRENINDANIIINFNEASTLQAEIIEGDKTIFQLSDKQQVNQGDKIELDATNGIVQLVLNYTGNTPKEHVGQSATIRLSSQYTDENGTSGTASIDVKITIEEKPTITFLPTDGKGAYTIKHTDGRNIGYTMPIDETQNIYVPLTQENMATFELNFTKDKADDGLTFAGWQMIVDGVATYFSYDKKCTYSFKQTASVRPMFLADDRAVFTILKDQQARKYYDLQLALDDAKKLYDVEGNPQVVVFSNEGKQSGTLYQGHYTIPQGITLLIPGVGPGDNFKMRNEADEDQYVCRLKREGEIPNTTQPTEVILTLDDYISDQKVTAPVCYRKLMVQDNTTFTVESGANINLYSVLNRDGQKYEARPYHYGQIHLGENCQINIEDGGTLYAFGYITGSKSSQVSAASGAEVHEVFQYSDPRGGTGVAHLYLCREDYRVFPFSQYYIQNIEVPFEMKSGATQYITTTADVLSEFVLAATFIIPNSEPAEKSALFRMGESTTIRRYYDPLTDRIRYTIKGETAGATAQLSTIKIELGDLSSVLGDVLGNDLVGGLAGVLMSDLSNVTLNSQEYALPINHNMEVELDNITFTSNSDFAFLAGSTMIIHDNATFNLKKGSIYLYDAEQNLMPQSQWTNETKYADGTGYFSDNKSPLEVISYTPNSTHLQADKKTKKRLAKDVKDSKWLVNGKIIINAGAGLYTTAGKAQIYSTANGQVQFANALNSTKTMQAKYKGGGASALISWNGILPEIAVDGVHERVYFDVTSAALQHANGDYLSTTKGTYYYNPAKGMWETSKPASTNIPNTEIRVTLPDYDLATEAIDPWPTTITAQLSDPSAASISWGGGTGTAVTPTSDAQGAHFAVTYTPSNIASEHEGLITADDKSYSIRLTVIEDYTPRFTTLSDWETSAYLGYSTEVKANINPEEMNVAGILSGKYAPKWSYAITGTNADEFQFQWGEGDNYLTDAKIIFRPKIMGNNKQAVLSLTCSYTDAANLTHTTCVQVPLTANAFNLQPNNLAFAVDSIFQSSSNQPLFTGGNGMTIKIEGKYTGILTITNPTQQSATVTPVAGKAGQSVTLTVTQDPDLDEGIAGKTITQTITVTDDIVWNWKHLYFGSTNTNPMSVAPGVTVSSLEIAASHTYEEDGKTITSDGDRYDVVFELEKTDGSVYNNLATIANWLEGETEVWFTVTYSINNEQKTQDFKSEVYRDPRELTVAVTDDRIYEALTIASIGTEYNSGAQRVQFTSTKDKIAQWTAHFIGIPDQLIFKPTGDNLWQIEESSNGTNWTISHTWVSIEKNSIFEFTLQPSTRFIRISYGTNGTGEVMGALQDVTITELTSVKADVEKIYLPDPSATKSVVFTYVSEAGYTLSTSDAKLITDLSTLAGSTAAPYYQIQRVKVSNKETDNLTGYVQVDNTDTRVGVRTFTYPQVIPIQLASDPLERYYFVASNSYRTHWQTATRTIVMRNAVADASPYVIFHFADKPTAGVISFNYSAGAQGQWIIESSVDGDVWTKLESNDAEDLSKQLLFKNFNQENPAQYVRVKYISDYAEVINITNLAILPTTSTSVTPAELIVYDDKNELLTISANNLKDIQFDITSDFKIVKGEKDNTEYTAEELTNLFVGEGTKKADVYIRYSGTAAITNGVLTLKTTKDAEGNSIDPKVLATVQLTGLKRNLPNGATGINTGTELTISGFNKDVEAKHRPVNTQHAFASNKPLFDYVIIYGETTTSDGASTIMTPTSDLGSNAKTPCLIYKSDGSNYVLNAYVENANSSNKSWEGAVTVPEDKSLSVYITGFCPYASTGYSKSDEGVWYFEGKDGDKIDIYLQDCYIYSRYKTKTGKSFSRSNGESYSDKVVRGSGGVLVFANTTASSTDTMRVTIHTRDKNLLRSHYGCLFESIVGRAFQVSAPVQIYMKSVDHFNASKTSLTFTDEWPTSTEATNGKIPTERTNGSLSLRKQVNNAPSIDMGNANTVVNFRGGQIELQNACNSSDNYESTLAICYRTGMYGPAKFRFVLSHGIGTDGTGGRVNFYDGTTTVIKMEVPERYRQYYLMNEDNGTATSCLRTPKNTFIYGGSHCMMRACPEPTNSGGAPTDGDVTSTTGEDGSIVETITGNPLAPFAYKNIEGQGWNDNGNYGLVTPNNFPGNLVHETTKTKLSDVHGQYPGGKYGVESVTPVNDQLTFWVPAGYVEGAEPEVNAKISYWKACMTYIEAKYGVYEGNIGGPTSIEFTGEGTEAKQAEEVYNLLYCEIDENISGVIAQSEYEAPVLNPAPTSNPDEKYMSIKPTTVGNELQNYITNSQDYEVKNKVYYIVPAKADIWMTFTAPFDIEKVWVMETYDESELSSSKATRAEKLQLQATHNANFASFFGVALALDSKKDFDAIYNDYMGWAKAQDNHTSGSYTKRGRYPLTHYYRYNDPDGNVVSNWNTSSYYLYKNGTWTYDEENGVYQTKWDFVVPTDGVLMKQGETYSMQFPYCAGCWDENDSRDFWDYWTGKFLIFESTDGPHTIKGSDFVGSQLNTAEFNTTNKESVYEWNSTNDFLDGKASDNIYGNSTFAMMCLEDGKVYKYDEVANYEGFTSSMEENEDGELELTSAEIAPTKSFLYAGVPSTDENTYVRRITREGKIIYGSSNTEDDGSTTTDGGHMPTVGGGNDLFITAINEGVNIAVAEPQVVRVLSSTGAVIYSGMVETSVDVNLPTNGIYVISGENEVQKILY